MLFAAVAIVVALLTQAAPGHTTHYPRHGGQLFPMAGDTVHVEGTWPSQRVFRLYVYDVDSRPLAEDRLRAITGKVEAGGSTIPLVLRDGEDFFEARLPTLKVPAEIALQLTLAGGAAEGVYFIFPGYSDDRALTFALESTVIPETLAATMAALRADIRDADALMAQQQSAFVFGPAIRARDHALALERFLPAAGAVRSRAATQIREAVRTAWLVHLAADEGTVADVEAALEELRRVAGDLALVFRVNGQ